MADGVQPSQGSRLSAERENRTFAASVPMPQSRSSLRECPSEHDTLGNGLDDADVAQGNVVSSAAWPALNNDQRPWASRWIAHDYRLNESEWPPAVVDPKALAPAQPEAGNERPERYSFGCARPADAGSVFARVA